MGRKSKKKRVANAPDAFGQFRPRGKKTAPGTHIPVMARDIMRVCDPRPGEIIADCTLGYGGHAEMLLKAALPDGRLIGLDVDAIELHRTARRLAAVEGIDAEALTCVHESYDRLAEVLAANNIDGCDVLLADLGVSSMQVDDPQRGVSYKHDNAPLDMRMDTRLQRTAADLLADLSAEQLAAAFTDYADEPDAERIAEWIVAQRQVKPIESTAELTRLILNAKGVTGNNWRSNPVSDFGKHHPAARVYQALRIVVNDELGRLQRLLELIPTVLRPGGRAAIIAFHSGEDRLVAAAFAQGLENGSYAEISPEALTPPRWEQIKNWRSSSAKLRWARKPS